MSKINRDFEISELVYFIVDKLDTESMKKSKIKLTGTIESIDGDLALIKFTKATNLLIKEPTMYVTLDELNKI